ncbi:Sodium-coupled monocarboxylate transporter 1, variant 2 [Chamberlinius hualienensis]
MDSGSTNHLKLVDYIILGTVLLISASIGVYYRLTGGKQKTVGEYLLAGKDMGVAPVAFSLMASFMSAITLLGVASENYVWGTQFVLINIAYIIGTPFVAFCYLPVFFKMQCTSVYEYLEKRFGRTTRIVTGISFQLQMVIYMGIVLYAPSLAMSAVTGLSLWVAVISIGLVCTFYSTIGGMKAVLWTDVFQSLLMFAAVFAVIIKGISDMGFSTILQIAQDGQRLEFFKTDTDPTVRHTLWTQCIGGIFTYTAIYGVTQTQVQRLLTVSSLKKSQLALFISWPILTLLSLTTSFSGLVIYSAYRDCDPKTSRRISSQDQLLPLFVMDFLSAYPGVPGLFVSGIFSATLSTVSSAVNSLSAVTLEDYVKPLINRPLSETKQAFISKIIVLSYGFLCLALTIIASQMGNVLQASLTIFNVVGGPVLGLFSLGMFCPMANEIGALTGLILGLGVSCWIGFGAALNAPYNPPAPISVSGCANVTNVIVNATLPSK